MKKGLVWISILVLFLSGCSVFCRKAAQPIEWPEKINYMEALCDLDMAWKDMRYSGSMSLRLTYPDAFQLEVYGPFGDTAVFVKKGGGSFILVAGDERFTDERAFENKFDIRLQDFMDDITFHGPVQEGSDGPFVERRNYRVTYNKSERGSRFCWRGADGSICMRFLEARFGRE